MLQITQFCGVKILAWKSVGVFFWTNIIYAGVQYIFLSSEVVLQHSLPYIKEQSPKLDNFIKSQEKSIEILVLVKKHSVVQIVLDHIHHSNWAPLPATHAIFDYKNSYHETNLTTLASKILTVFLCILFAVSDSALPQHRAIKFCPCPVHVALCCSNPSLFYHIEKFKYQTIHQYIFISAKTVTTMSILQKQTSGFIKSFLSRVRL